MVRKSISKVNDFPIFVEDVENMWGHIRFTDAFNIFLNHTHTYDNVHVDTPGAAPLTDGDSEGPITVTNDQTFGYFKIMLIGTGDVSACTLTLNRVVQQGEDEVGRWFSVDEATFTYTIAINDAGGGAEAVSIEKIVIVGMRFSDPPATLYCTLS
jgi:hypothetical protein